MILPRRAGCDALTRRCAASLLLAWAILSGTPGSVQAQLQVSTIRGTVTDIQQQPIVSAALTLQDVTGATVRAGTSGADGTFHIGDVAPGSYVIRVQVQGTTVLSQPLVVRGSLPIDLRLQAGLVRHDQVVVRGDGGPSTVERPWSLAGEVVRENMEALPAHRLQSALASLPGWSGEDNGLLHVRGVDDGLLYVQDGVPIYERIDRLFGLGPNPSGIASVHVTSGYIPPEFGLKSGGVIEVRSETGLRDAWSGALETGAGEFGTGHLNGLVSGPIASSGGLMLTGSIERSSRFLDPVAVENFHNTGHASAGSAHWTLRPAADVISVTIGGGQSRYDVPHIEDQEEAGQDQRQRTAQWLASVTWQRVLSSRTVWQASGYLRKGSGTVYGSANDTPISLDAERGERRSGALFSLTHQRSRHTWKTGGELSGLHLDERFLFAVTDLEEGEEAGLSDGALEHDPSNPFEFVDERQPTLWSAYIQDVWQASNRLTLNFGVRFDSSRVLVEAHQWSPRVGVAFQWRPRTIVRASVMRLFQPPQAEYLLLASSPAARELSPFVEEEGGGGSSIPPERQTALDASISHEMAGGWRLEAGTWLRRAREVGDPNVFFGTTVTAPNSVARQHASGFDLRLDMRQRRGWSASAGYTHARVKQFGPITGGLFLEDDYLEIRDGTPFTPDHDQRHGVHGSATYSDEHRRWRISGVIRYQTGTPLEVEEDDIDEILERPGSEVVDVESGRVRPRTIVDVQGGWTFYRGPRTSVSLTAWMTNVFNHTYAFNFGNPFSGTHFGSPRRVGVSLTARFGRNGS